MDTKITPIGKKVVTVIPQTTHASQLENVQHNKRIRVAAYCRVSTDSDEQINSYEVQKKKYTEMIQNEPGWELVKIYADKGITGTSTKNRDEFNNMIRQCKRGKIDMIITKSVSRFARNNLDTLKYTRMLRKLGVDVYFEEQTLHSIKPNSDFMISIYGTLAQSESENMSANVKWGKLQSAKEGKVQFQYKNTIGYKRGADGNPEIVPEEAEIIKRIFTDFVKGKTINQIAKDLDADGIKTPSGGSGWSARTIRGILTNVRFKGDLLINKTYVEDCISKKVKTNMGERPQFYVRNNHPGIIDEELFDRAQEEMAKRNGRKIHARLKTITELGKYHGRYALTDILVCGCCGTPYRRKIYQLRDGTNVPVWRCIKRMDKKEWCPTSPTLTEEELQKAILEVIVDNQIENEQMLKLAKENLDAVLGFKASGIRGVELQIKIQKLNSKITEMLNSIKFDDDMNPIGFDEELCERLMLEKNEAEEELERIIEEDSHESMAESKIDEMLDIIAALKKHPRDWDDIMIRQLIDRVIIEDEHTLRVIFASGFEAYQTL